LLIAVQFLLHYFDYSYQQSQFAVNDSANEYYLTRNSTFPTPGTRHFFDAQRRAKFGPLSRISRHLSK